jgi:hypothetical protein
VHLHRVGASSGMWPYWLWILLLLLGGCCHLDGLEQQWSLSGGWCLSPTPIGDLWEVFVPIPRERSRKATLVDCSWLVDPLLCWFLRRPSGGLGVWCLLVHEPPSECIATMRMYIAGKQLNLKDKSCVSIVSLVFYIDTCPVWYWSLPHLHYFHWYTCLVVVASSCLS